MFYKKVSCKLLVGFTFDSRLNDLVKINAAFTLNGFDQGWWSRINFNGSRSCSRARFSKIISSDSGSGAGHFPFMAPTPAPFDPKFAGSSSDPAPLQLHSEIKFAISH